MTSLSSISDPNHLRFQITSSGFEKTHSVLTPVANNVSAVDFKRHLLLVHHCFHLYVGCFTCIHHVFPQSIDQHKKKQPNM